MSKVTTRIFLGLALLLALGTALFSITAVLDGKNEAWATLAAALAVVTSMISAWGAQRVVELEEEKRMPFPYPIFDVTSRYGLMLLKLTNYGGGAAHHIKILWDKPLKNSKGEVVQFGQNAGLTEVPVLVPGQHISIFVDGHIEFFSQSHEHTYTGTVEFQDAAGIKREHKFMLDAEAYKGSPLYDDENLKTHYQLQKLPEHLQALNVHIKSIADLLSRGIKSDSRSKESQ